MGYLDNAGLTRVWQKIKTLLSGKVDKVDGMGLSQENYSTEDKNSLTSIQTAMELLASAGSICTSEGALIVDSDSLHIVNVRVVKTETVDEKDAKIVQDVVERIQSALYAANAYTDEKMNHSIATQSEPGFMSATDKQRLDELWNARSANNNSLSTS